MSLLQLLCKSCRVRFVSGVPFRREHLEGVKLRTLEVCPACGAAADYSSEDYLDPVEGFGPTGPGGSASEPSAPQPPPA